MPKAIKVKRGDEYGLLTIIQELPRKGRRRHFLCECSCPTKTRVPVLLESLRCGNTNSCGCYKKQRISETKSTHKDTCSPEYNAWSNIINRCENQNNTKDWACYGGRGITICPAWRHDYSAFLAYVGRRPSTKHSIDRYPNPNGNYEPGNIRWATPVQQGLNKHSTIYVVYNGQRRKLQEVCIELGFLPKVVAWRRQQGWPDKDLFKPMRYSAGETSRLDRLTGQC